MMLQTSNRSILVIEDIECSTNIPDRNGTTPSKSKSRSDAKLLNFIDGMDNANITRKRSKPDKHGHGCNKTVEVAGELMKSDNAEVVLDGLVKFLEGKKKCAGVTITKGSMKSLKLRRTNYIN
ncbi:hypothetical protein Tco_0271795 [Tanacetum coccineum]